MGAALTNDVAVASDIAVLTLVGVGGCDTVDDFVEINEATEDSVMRPGVDDSSCSFEVTLVAETVDDTD